MSDFDLHWNGEAFLFEVNKISKSAMRKAALEVEREAKLSFGRGASSLDGTVKRGKKRHRPSAEGFPPNVDFGILKSSVDISVERITAGSKTADKVEGFVGSNIDRVERKLRESKKKIKNMRTVVQYGFFLEVGTKNMRPRPWLLPALRKASPRILKIFRKAVL